MYKPEGKYAIIVTDDRENAVNGHVLLEKLTMEQVYDLFHHTHYAKDLIGSVDGSGDTSVYESLQKIEDSVKKVENTLNDTNVSSSEFVEL